MSPECAKAILSLKFARADEVRMRALMERNNRGTITETSALRWKAITGLARFSASGRPRRERT